jgi:hypothetical protein
MAEPRFALLCRYGCAMLYYCEQPLFQRTSASALSIVETSLVSIAEQHNMNHEHFIKAPMSIWFRRNHLRNRKLHLSAQIRPAAKPYKSMPRRLYHQHITSLSINSLELSMNTPPHRPPPHPHGRDPTFPSLAPTAHPPRHPSSHHSSTSSFPSAE